MNDIDNEFVVNNIIDFNRRPAYVSDTLDNVTGEEYASVFNNNTSVDSKNQIFKKLISNTLLDDILSQYMADSIFRYLLNRKGSYDVAEVNFITYYTIYLNYRKIKYDDNGKVREGVYSKAEMPDVIIDYANEENGLDHSFAAYDSADNIVLINIGASIEPFINGDKDKLFAYLQYISHEMVHYRQAFELRNRILSIASFNFILCRVMRYQDFDDNANNYRFRKSEVEAQIDSMKFALELGRNYFPEYVEFQERMIESRESYLLEEAVSRQNDIEGALLLRDFYDIAGLSVAVSERPYFFLNGWPQLMAFYNDDGHLKSEEELLEQYAIATENKEEIASIYEDLLIYIYNREDTITNKDLPDELLSIKKEFVEEQVEKEYAIINDIKWIVFGHFRKIGKNEEWQDTDVKEIIQMRKRRIELYYKFLFSIDDYKNTEVLDDYNNIIDEYDEILNNIDYDKQTIIGSGESNNEKGILL